MKHSGMIFSLSLMALIICHAAQAQQIQVQYKPDYNRFSSKQRAHYRDFHIKIEFKNSKGGKAIEDIKLEPPSNVSISGRNYKIIHNVKALGNVTSIKISTMGEDDYPYVPSDEFLAMLNSLMGEGKPDIMLDCSVKVKKTSKKFAVKDQHRHSLRFKLEVYPISYKGSHWDKKLKDAGVFTNDKDFYASRETIQLRKKLKG